MRILIVSNCELNPNQGSGYVITGYANRMREKGHIIDIYGPEHFTLFPSCSRLNRIRLLLGYTITACSKSFDKPYDIIELWGAPAWLSIRILRGFKTSLRSKLVARSNGLEPHRRFIETGSLPKWNRYAQCIKQCDGLVLVSHFDKKFAEKHSYQEKNRILTLENPVEDGWIKQPVNLEREPLIGFVGNWLPNKGSLQVPIAIRKLRTKFPTCKVVLIGVGENAQKKLAQEFSGDPNISVISQCAREALKAHYHKMAVFILPSKYESFGLTAVEAMTCGAALASTKTGFPDSLYHDSCEFITDLSSDAICEAVSTLLYDENRRKSIASSGYNRVQALNWRHAVEQLETFYGLLISAEVEN